MLRQRSSRLDPDRAGDEGRRRPERVRGASSRHRRHRPGVECLEDRRLLSAITEFPLPTSTGSPRRPDGRPRRQPLVHRVIRPSGQLGAIGRITPAGAITEFPLPAGHGSPGDLTVGPDGNLWFPEYRRPARSAGSRRRAPSPSSRSRQAMASPRRPDGRPRRQPLVHRAILGGSTARARDRPDHARGRHHRVPAPGRPVAPQAI